MMHYNVKPWTVDLRPSPSLAALLLAAAGAAAGLVWLLPWGMWVRLGLIVAIAVAVHGALARHARLRGAAAVVALELAADGSFSVRLGDGGWRPAVVAGSSTVTPWLTVLNLRLAGRQRGTSVVILPDRLGTQEFRRLRVWLRWASQRSTAVS